MYLAYLGHLRLDGWGPLPAAHPFTLQVKRALEDEDATLLGGLSDYRPLPSCTGQTSQLSVAVFPKWWLDPNVLTSDWKQFDLGEHICTYHAALLDQVSLNFFILVLISPRSFRLSPSQRRARSPRLILRSPVATVSSTARARWRSFDEKSITFKTS